MDEKLEKMIALKAHYLGRKISSSKENMNRMRLLVDKAIQMYEDSKSYEKCIRLVFYLLIRAEMLRGIGDSIIFRKKAKDICDDIGSNIFKYYMDIVDATTLEYKTGGIGGTIITGGGVSTIKKDVITDCYNFKEYVYDAAWEALDMEAHKISRRDIKFLYDVSLEKILKKHGVL